jgi:protein-disulfide isomerase
MLSEELSASYNKGAHMEGIPVTSSPQPKSNRMTWVATALMAVNVLCLLSAIGGLSYLYQSSTKARAQTTVIAQATSTMNAQATTIANNKVTAATQNTAIAEAKATVLAQRTAIADAKATAMSTYANIKRYDVPTTGFYGIGTENAPIVIIEFSDYQCPFCKRFHDQVFQPLMDAYPGKIRFVYRNLPLTQIHPQAMNAAEASMCAGEQDAYWPYHDKLFENGDALSDDLYSSLASDLGLNLSNFETCMSDHKYRSDIQSDTNFASTLGIQSTPTFFINGLAVVGAQPLTAFKQIIDDELSGRIP